MSRYVYVSELQRLYIKQPSFKRRTKRQYTRALWMVTDEASGNAVGSIGLPKAKNEEGREKREWGGEDMLTVPEQCGWLQTKRAGMQLVRSVCQTRMPTLTRSRAGRDGLHLQRRVERQELHEGRERRERSE